MSMALVLILSNVYNISNKYAVKTGMRGVALGLINLGVKIYDPANVIKAATGREIPGNEKVSTYATGEHELKRMLDEMPAFGGKVALNKYDNQKIVYEKYGFGYEPYLQERKDQLNRYYQADSSLVSANDFNETVKIRNFVKSLWKHGGDLGFNPDGFDAVEVINKAKAGKKYWCHVYALTFVQFASSAGITARLVGLSDDGYERDHAVAEVWSNYYRKWVLMDIDYNIHYVRTGEEVPLNTVELHNAYVNGETDDIRVIKGSPRPVGYEVEDSESRLLQYYTYINVDLRNDWYVNDYMKGHPQASDFATLSWKDDGVPGLLNLFKKVSDHDSFYWTLNQTEIYFKRGDGNILELYLETVTPNMSSWSATIDDSRDIQLNNHRYSWELHEGHNSFSVRSVNQYGVKGIISTIALVAD